MLSDSSTEVLGSNAIRESLRLQNLRQRDLLVQNNTHLDFQLSYMLGGYRVKSARLQKRKKELTKILKKNGNPVTKPSPQKQDSPSDVSSDSSQSSVKTARVFKRPETAPSRGTKDKENHEMPERSPAESKKDEVGRKFSLLMAKASNIPHMQTTTSRQNEKEKEIARRKSFSQSWGSDAKSFWKVPGLQARYVAAPPDFSRRFKSEESSTTKGTCNEAPGPLSPQEARESNLLNLFLQSSQSVQTLPMKHEAQSFRTRKHSTVYAPVIRDDDYVTLYSSENDINRTLEMPPMMLPAIDARKAFLIECNVSKKPQLRTLTDRDWAELRKCRYIRRGSQRFQTPTQSTEDSEKSDVVSL